MKNDKRRYKRVACRIESIYKTHDPGALFSLKETTVRDISQGGIRFRSNQFIPIRHKISVKLSLPKAKPIEVVAETAWQREIPELSLYEIGSRFLILSNEDKTAIQKIVDEG